MRRFAVSALLFVLAIAGSFASAPDENIQAAGQEWFTDYKAGLEKARAENKPIFLEFRCVP